MPRKRRTPTPAEDPPSSLLSIPGAQTGDIHAHHIAGGDLITTHHHHHYGAGPAGRATSEGAPRLEDLLTVAQRQLLAELHRETGAPRRSVDVATWLGWSHQDVMDELRLLIPLGLVSATPRPAPEDPDQPPVALALTGRGREVCRNLVT